MAMLLGLVVTAVVGDAPAVRVLDIVYNNTMEGHYDLGFSVGVAFATDIRNILVPGDPELQQLLLFTQNNASEGPSIVAALSADSSAQFPKFWAELEGLAAGSGVPLHTIIVNNYREELCQFCPSTREARVGKCSSAFVNSKSGLLLGHNDDWTQPWRGASYWVTARCTDCSPALSWGTWVYPGYLFGMDLSWNSNGLVYSVNSLFPTHFLRGGIGTAFAARSLLEATSLADAINRVAVAGVSTAMSYNLGSTVESRLLECEVNTGGSTAGVAIHEILPGQVYFHGNSFTVTANASQFPSNSTAARAARWDAMQPITNRADILRFLGDRKGALPVWRNHTPPDTCYTEVTALFDLRGKQLSVWTENPLSGSAQHTFTLP